MSDSALKQDVLNKLDFEPSIDAAYIGVAVEHGVGTLTGHASTYAQKAATEAATRQVKGARGIAQEIEVRHLRCEYHFRCQDCQTCPEHFGWSKTIPDNAVQVTVQRGW